MVEIRVFEPEDEAAVAALWREVFAEAPAHNVPEEDIRRKLAVQRDLFFVAVEGEELVGTAMAGYDGHRGWVYYVAVKPARRRRGIGAALMKRVEEGLAAAGCPKLNLQVRGENETAVAFYERLGYDIEDRVSMAKRLSGAGGADERTNIG
jgi:ribosomal protein S18 acetylase RimI-like enzyme